MIWREFCKYGRQFWWLILLYVGWIVLITFLTATHQVFVSESSGMRRFAMEIEPHETLVGLTLLVVFLVSLWREDPIWEPKAFWKSRPISSRDQITAKVLWLAFLGGLLPAISGILTTYTAQMGWAESWAFGAWQGLFYLAIGSFVSNLVFISKRWEEIGVNLAIHLPLVLIHGLCWAVLGNKFLGWLVYLALMVAGLGTVLAVTLRRAEQSRAVVASLIVLSIIGAFIAIVVPFDKGSRHGNTSETMAMLTVIGDPLLLEPGIKTSIDSQNVTAPRFRYWYQVNLLGRQPTECAIQQWDSGSSGTTTKRVGILPGRVRIMGSLSLAGEEGSGASVRRRYR